LALEWWHSCSETRRVPVEILSYVLRGKVRRAVFSVFFHEPLGPVIPKSASGIQRALRGSCPLTLNQAIRALRELHRAGLVAPDQSCERLQTYAQTPLGLRLANFLQQTRGISLPISR
jgi:hypothetical protein